VTGRNTGRHASKVADKAPPETPTAISDSGNQQQAEATMADASAPTCARSPASTREEPAACGIPCFLVSAISWVLMR